MNKTLQNMSSGLGTLRPFRTKHKIFFKQAVHRQLHEICNDDDGRVLVIK